jgi:hypothetical protein
VQCSAIYFGMADNGANRLPVFPAPSFIDEGEATKQSSGETSREKAKVCPQ